MKRLPLVAALVVITAILAVWATRELWPRKVVEQSVPRIVTRYDTVPTLPEWYTDSVRHWKKRKYTTDTVPLVLTETVVDTEYVPVTRPPEERPNIWPLLRYSGGRSFGDTAVVTTFNLRDGKLAVSQLFIPGMLTAIDASDTLRTPRINYAPFPPGEKHGFWHNPKIFGAGFLSCAAIGLAVNVGR